MRFFTRQQPPFQTVAERPEDVIIPRSNPLAQFPSAVGASEPLWDYRHAMGPRMRAWVIYTLAAAGIYAVVPADEATILCEDVATQQLRRGLHLANETALLREAVRDVLAAREAPYRHDAYLDDAQGGAA